MSEQTNIDSIDTSNAKYKPLTPEQRAKKQERFLQALGKHGVVKVACKYAGISRQTYYDWRDHDEAFKERLPDAFEERNDTLEYAAYTQAVEGVPSYVVSQGKIVYHEIPGKNEDGTPKLDKHGNPIVERGKPIIERKYAPGLLQTLLKANMPDKYKERAAYEHTGKDGGPLSTSTTLTLDLAKLRDATPEQLAVLRSLALDLKARE